MSFAAYVFIGALTAFLISIYLEIDSAKKQNKSRINRTIMILLGCAVCISFVLLTGCTPQY